MGCLIEFFVEFVGEFFCELILEGYLALMCMIMPKRKGSRRFQTVVKTVVIVLSLLLLAGLVTGVFLLFHEDAGIRTAGKITLAVSASAILTQIGLGIMMRAISSKNNR